jgi:hypothetical protein
MTLGIFFFALYDILVYYMTYKDAIAPSPIYNKNQENTATVHYIVLIGLAIYKKLPRSPSPRLIDRS